jgi:hypothetical protein
MTGIEWTVKLLRNQTCQAWLSRRRSATWRLAVSNSVTFNTLGKIEVLIHFDKADG